MSIDTADHTIVADVTDGATPEPPTDGPPDAPPSVLRPAAVTAAREQERLRLAEGKAGLAAFTARLGPKIRHLGSAEAAADGLRYRPVAWTVIAVVAVSFFLPGRAERVPTTQPVASPSPVVTVVTPTTLASDDEVASPFLPAGPTPAFTPTPIDAPSFGPTPTSPPTSVAPTDEEGVSAIGRCSCVSPQLTIRGWAWASRVPAGTVPADAVPENTLPVGKRLGQVDRVSFIRLDGTEGTLTLTEADAGAREALGAGKVAACPVLVSDWAEGADQSFADAPPWSTDSCVGSVEKDGRWVFDLGSFPFRTGPAGFALVPAADAPPDFQVTFRIS